MKPPFNADEEDGPVILPKKKTKPAPDKKLGKAEKLNKITSALLTTKKTPKKKPMDDDGDED